MAFHHLRIRTSNKEKGFTLIELLIGSTIMLMVIIGALQIYSKSNQVSVDQQQYSEVQHDVRASMYLIARDARMAGAGLPQEFIAYALEGRDNEDQGTGAEVTPDRLKIMGNIDEPWAFMIQDYNGSSVNLTIEPYGLERYPYPEDYYDGKIVLVLPNPTSSCPERNFREISDVDTNEGNSKEKLIFAPGQAQDINPPGGLSTNACPAGDYIGGLVTIINVREYWLDTTGSISGLTAGTNGYLGQSGVLYVTDEYGTHCPLAQDIENLQFEYNGDLDDNGTLDGFVSWSSTWTGVQIARIRQVRIMVLGRTPNKFLSVSGTPPGGIHLYRRPKVSNTDAAADSTGSPADDGRRRFLLETTSNIRNMSLNFYNTGERN